MRVIQNLKNQNAVDLKQFLLDKENWKRAGIKTPDRSYFICVNKL